MTTIVFFIIGVVLGLGLGAARWQYEFKARETVAELADLEAGALYCWKTLTPLMVRRYIGCTSLGTYYFETLGKESGQNISYEQHLIGVDKHRLVGRITLGEFERVEEPA